MLKRFFISMLGTMAGLWLSIIIFGIVLIIGLAASIAKALTGVETKPTEGILYVNLQGDIPELPGDYSITDLINNEELPTSCLADIVSAIRLSANDSKIKGIFIQCNGAAMGVASRSEVIDALKDFKQSGKWVYAYADTYEQGDYYIASAADKLFLNPVGSVNVHGLGTQTIFFTGLLEKVGVQVQIVKVGQFKSAVEPFIRKDMSEASRLQTQIFVDQLWGCMAQEIAESRGVDTTQVNQWANSMSFTWAPEAYCDNKMVSELKYYTEVETLLREKADVKKDDDLPLVNPTDYMSNYRSKENYQSKKHIAVLYAVGDIVDDGTEGIVDDLLVPQIGKLAKDDNVLGLVMRVNSGGGSAFASEQIWHALEDFKQTGKPFYVSMGDYAASGGYYISCGADKIFADPTTLTGSIGIFGMIPNAKVLLTDKLGLNFETVATSPDATYPTLTEPATERQLSAMQTYVDRGYETFTSRVAEGRHLPIDSVKAIGGGRVWDGMSALRIGLVDELGSLNSAVQAMASKVDLAAEKCVIYPEIEQDWLLMLMSTINSENEMHLSPELKQAARLWRFTNAVQNMHPVQARMEYMIIE